MEILTQLHPPVVHFAIALTITGILFEVLYFIFRLKSLKHAGFWTFMFGVIAVWVAMLTGDQAAELVEDNVYGTAKELLENHEEIGEILPWIFTVLGGMRLFMFFREIKFLRLIFLVLGLLSIGLVGYQGNLGGKMVYEYGVGVKVQKPVPTKKTMNIP